MVQFIHSGARLAVCMLLCALCALPGVSAAQTSTERPSTIGSIGIDGRTSTSLTVKWTHPDDFASPVSGVESYNIYIGHSSSNTKVATVGRNVTSYKIENLSPGTWYVIRVRSANAAGEGYGSRLVGTETYAPPPSTELFSPHDLTLTPVSSTQLLLTWKDSINEFGGLYTTPLCKAGYHVEIRTENSAFTSVCRSWPGTTKRLFSDLKPNTRYGVRLTAFNNDIGIVSPQSETVWATTPASNSTAADELSAPVAVTATPLSPGVRFSWVNTAPTATNLQWQVNSGFGWSQLSTVQAGTSGSWSDSSMPAGQHRFRARAVNGNSVSDWVETGSVVVTGAEPFPSPPVRLSASAVSHSAIRVTWNDVATNEVAYVVERKNPAGEYVEVGRTAPNASSWQDNGLDSGVEYHYRVRSEQITYGSPWRYTEAQAGDVIGNPGDGNNNPEEPVDPSTNTRPIAPARLTAHYRWGQNRVVLRWADRADNETLYRVVRNGRVLKTLKKNAVSFVDRSIDRGQRYSYRVIAVNGNGGTGSNTIATRTVGNPRQVLLSVRKRIDNEKTSSAVLSWSGARTATVDVYRNNRRISRVANSNRRTYRQQRNTRSVYRICDAGTTRCSANITLQH